VCSTVLTYLILMNRNWQLVRPLPDRYSHCDCDWTNRNIIFFIKRRYKNNNYIRLMRRRERNTRQRIEQKGRVAKFFDPYPSYTCIPPHTPRGRSTYDFFKSAQSRFSSRPTIIGHLVKYVSCHVTHALSFVHTVFTTGGGRWLVMAFPARKNIFS